MKIEKEYLEDNDEFTRLNILLRTNCSKTRIEMTINYEYRSRCHELKAIEEDSLTRNGTKKVESMSHEEGLAAGTFINTNKIRREKRKRNRLGEYI